MKKKFLIPAFATTLLFSGISPNIFKSQEVHAEEFLFFDEMFFNEMFFDEMFFGDMFSTPNSFFGGEMDSEILASNEAVIDDILSQLIKDGFTEEQKVKAIYDFLIYQFVHLGNSDETACPVDKQISYNVDQVYAVDSATSLLAYGMGVCDDFAALFKTLLTSVGIDCIVVGGDYINRNGTTMPHAWNMAKIDGVWYHFDVDVEGSVYRRGDVTTGQPIYFLYKKDTEYWRTNHYWDEEHYNSITREIDANSDDKPKDETPVLEESSNTPENLQSEDKQALSTSSNVLVNGELTAFDAYNIDGNNYFKLRDLAYALNGSSKNFEVTWDGVQQAVNIVSNTKYTVADGDMSAPSGEMKIATKSTAKILLDSQAVDATAYNISDNNFFGLRDICKYLDIGVTWDGSTNTIGIDTSIGYTE